MDPGMPIWHLTIFVLENTRKRSLLINTKSKYGIVHQFIKNQEPNMVEGEVKCKKQEY